MTIFVVSGYSDTPSDKLPEVLEREVAEADRIKLTQLTWLVAFNGSSKELQEKLGIKKGGLSGFVSTATEISGVGSFELAQWIKAKQSGE